jgi:MYXO-CTERM domain-containing protein
MGVRTVRRSVALGALATALLGCEAESETTLEPVEAPGVQIEVRPDTPGSNLQFSFDRGDVVETFVSSDGNFTIHFSRDGQHAVDLDDEDLDDVPDFVEHVAEVYVEVLAHYTALGFRVPESDGDIADNGGDDNFDVYLVDFAGIGDGAFRQDGCLPSNGERCIGFMTQENDYQGYGYPSTTVANRILGSHEFFHAVQAAYDVGQGTVFAEGTAVWATESFDPSLNDFEYFVGGFLQNPDRPLDEPLPGPVDPFSYGAAIFFKFLEERYGVDTIRVLIERTENGTNGNDDPLWITELDAVLGEVGDATFPEAMLDFAQWNFQTDDFANASSSYANGDAYDRVKIEEVDAPFSDDSIRVYHASAQYRATAPGTRTEMTAALVSSDEAELTDLRIVLATETGDESELLVLDDAVAGTQTIEVGSADRFVAIVVNTAATGDSKKPGLCMGDPDEVEQCKAALLSGGAGGAGGAGGSDAGGNGEGGAGGAGAGTEDEGCSCALSSSGSSGAGLLGLLGLGLLARRRRTAR